MSNKNVNEMLEEDAYFFLYSQLNGDTQEDCGKEGVAWGFAEGEKRKAQKRSSGNY